MTNFIKQQQELARAKGKIAMVSMKGGSRPFYAFSTDDLDTLISQIITNTGEELLRLAEEEERDCETDIGGADIDENIGYNEALDTLKKHIIKLTGVKEV